MSKTFAIVFDDKKRAKEDGFLVKLGDYLKRKFSSKKQISLESLLNGDAIIVDLDSKNYYVEEKFVDFITPTKWRRTKKSFNTDSENILFLMRNNQRIFSLIYDLLDQQNDEQTVIYVRPVQKQPVVKKVKINTIDPVYIYDRYVRVGWDTFKRHFDPWSGKSYVNVDGDIYYIKRNSFGQEYLSE